MGHLQSTSTTVAGKCEAKIIDQDLFLEILSVSLSTQGIFKPWVRVNGGCLGKTAPPYENRARINIHGGGTNHHHMLQALSSGPEPPLGLLHCMYSVFESFEDNAAPE